MRLRYVPVSTRMGERMDGRGREDTTKSRKSEGTRKQTKTKETKEESSRVHSPSRGGVVLPELSAVPQEREALPDGREALGHVVTQRVYRLERVGLRLFPCVSMKFCCQVVTARGIRCFVHKRRGEDSTGWNCQ